MRSNAVIDLYFLVEMSNCIIPVSILPLVNLKPLPSDFFDLWNIVDGNWNFYKTFVTQISPYQQVKATTSSSALTTTTRAIDQLLPKKQFESMASDLAIF